MTQSDPQDLVLKSRVPASARGQTLLAFLSERFRYHDRQRWGAELAAGRITLDGRPAAGHEVLRPGMRLVYEKAHREPPVDAAFTVLHQDDALVVVDKPAHLPVHADGPFIRHTLIHLLRERLDLPGLQLVHRLDRETSGVCLAAKDKLVQATLQAEFGAGRVEKVYVAVVEGLLAAPFVASQAIGHSATSTIRLRRSAAPDALEPQPATTRFEPIAHGGRRTLVRCVPTTGRTHQIRVHLEASGHPVVGDKLYGHPDVHYLDFVGRMKAGASVFAEGEHGPNRQLLHAHELILPHPTTGAQTRFVAPIPAEFERWLRS